MMMNYLKRRRQKVVEIEEMFESDNNPTGPNTTSEPVTIELEEVPESSNKKKTNMIIDIPIVCTCLQAVLINYMYGFTLILSSLFSQSEKVQLSDIKDVLELEYLGINN